MHLCLTVGWQLCCSQKNSLACLEVDRLGAGLGWDDWSSSMWTLSLETRLDWSCWQGNNRVIREWAEVYKVSWGLDLEPVHSVKEASSKSSPDLRDEETDNIFWWEMLLSHIAENMDKRGRVKKCSTAVFTILIHTIDPELFVTFVLGQHWVCFFGRKKCVWSLELWSC